MNIKAPSLNVLGKKLIECSRDPMTGFFRDGSCHTCREDQGSHTICCQMNSEFLAFSRYLGNDLSTPRPEFNFPGLKDGDWWCLCAARWLQAYENDCAPTVNLEATHKRSLEIVPLDLLSQFSHQQNQSF
jgi:uncharacterized protein (DUF2237 family)